MSAEIKSEDVWAIINGDRVISVRFSYSVADAEAKLKGGQVRKAKLAWRDEPPTPPQPPPKRTEDESLPTAELWG